MNDEIFEKLSKYRIHLRRGWFGNYCYGLVQRDFDELHKIYLEMGGRDRIKYSCPSCVLTMTRWIGERFFEYEKKIFERAEIVKEIEAEKKEQAEAPVKKKAPAKKNATKKKSTTKKAPTK